MWQGRMLFHENHLEYNGDWAGAPVMLNAAKVREYCQPPAGLVEKYVNLLPLRVVDHPESTCRCMDGYGIRDQGNGLGALEAMVKVVLSRKFGKTSDHVVSPWSDTITVHMETQLLDRGRGSSFDDTKPKSLEDIHPELDRHFSDARKEDVRRYVEAISANLNIGMPLYITGAVLNLFGAGAEEHSLYMIDGARRILATALSWKKNINILVVMHEDEFGRLQEKETAASLEKRIAAIKWFRTYQSIPLAGLHGTRSLTRYDLIDLPILKDSVVYDFGCNLGQACIKASQAGASKVVGFDVMDDTLSIASDIRGLIGFSNIHYFKVDFNGGTFDKLIDLSFPARSDYSFFFSVYRTKELRQRDRLFEYIIKKTTKGIFFEGHAHEHIDTPDYYDWLFTCFGLKYHFLGFGEQEVRVPGRLRPSMYEKLGLTHRFLGYRTRGTRPLYYLPLSAL